MVTQDKKNKAINSNKSSFLEKSDSFFLRKENLIVFIIVLLSIFFSLMLFDMKVSIAGDDSGYILSAKEFLDGTQFPLWHGSFYPIFLSFFMFFGGVNLLLFKCVSLLLIVGQLVITYFALKKVVSPTIVGLSVLLFAVNYSLLYHSSQTFSEPIFLFIQSCVLWLFFKIENDRTEDMGLNKKMLMFLLFGLSMFLLVITRNIGISIVLACILFFCINKRFGYAIYTFVSFLVFYIPFLLYKSFYWHVKGAGFEDQLLFGLYKDPYNSSKGIETFSGIIKRFCINSDLYLSRNLLDIFGLKDEMSDVSTSLTILMYILFIAIGIYLFKKSKEIFFLLIYVGFSLAATFITQQVCWDQLRLILVFAPLILVIIAFTINELLKKDILKKFQPFLFGFFVVLFFISFVKTVKCAKTNYTSLIDNVGGNSLSGYSPDWIHYIEACLWIKVNVPNDKIVGIRKPDIGFIYSNRNYVGIVKSFDVTVDDIINTCYKNKAKTYTILQLNDVKKLKSLDSIYKYGEYMTAIIFIEDGNYKFVYGCTETQNRTFTSTLKNCNINYVQNLESLKNISLKNFAMFPDSTYAFIKRNKLQYIVNASLRSFSKEKTSSIIGNISKMLITTSYKYPKLFQTIKQFGSDNDEPATIYLVGKLQ